MSRLSDELDAKSRQRAADMREVQNPEPQAAGEVTVFGLYTYQTINGQLTCHIYAPGTQTQCEQAGKLMQESASAANEPALSYMVLPVESLPA